MKLLAAIAAAAVIAPFAAFAQASPPMVSMEAVAEPMAPEEGDPIDINRYPKAQRDAIWESYASKTNVSVNLLYPIGGTMLTAVVSSVSEVLTGHSMGAFSVPIEIERCLNRELSVFGVIQPEWAIGNGETEATLALGAGVRKYFAGNAPQGFWMGAHASSVLPFEAATMRIEAGGNWLFANHFIVSFGGGLGVTYASNTLIPFTDEHMYFFPAAGLRFSIGFAI